MTVAQMREKYAPIYGTEFMEICLVSNDYDNTVTTESWRGMQTTQLHTQCSRHMTVLVQYCDCFSAYTPGTGNKKSGKYCSKFDSFASMAFDACRYLYHCQSQHNCNNEVDNIRADASGIEIFANIFLTYQKTRPLSQCFCA